MNSTWNKIVWASLFYLSAQDHSLNYSQLRSTFWPFLVKLLSWSDESYSNRNPIFVGKTMNPTNMTKTPTSSSNPIFSSSQWHYCRWNQWLPSHVGTQTESWQLAELPSCACAVKKRELCKQMKDFLLQQTKTYSFQWIATGVIERLYEWFIDIIM